jgi:serine protease Do
MFEEKIPEVKHELKSVLNDKESLYNWRLESPQLVKQPTGFKWFGYIIVSVVFSFIGGFLALTTLPLFTEGGSKEKVVQTIIVNDKNNLYTNANPVVDVAKQVGPAIVEIAVKGKANVQNQPNLDTDKSAGSGIIIDKRGYIVTNQHVIDNGDNIIVTLSNEKSYKAKVIGSDVRTDLAVLKIDADNLTVAQFGNSDQTQVGQLVIAIGNPLGKQYSHTVTAGIISAKNREIQVGPQTYQLLQTDAAINPGNSGGALLDTSGKIIGINSVKMASDEVEGMGFSIPINIAKPIINDIINKGRVIRPWLGISDANKVALYNAPNLDQLPKGHQPIPPNHPSTTVPKEDGKGVKIIVYAKSPAQKAGLLNNDIIVKVDNQAITTFFSLQKAIGSRKIGDKIKITVLRNGKTLTKEVTLEEMPEK